MTNGKPFLRIYGPLHALSSRGLHVRQSARHWKLIAPMSAESIELVRAFCESIGQAEAASLLRLLERSMRNHAELPKVCVRRALMEGGEPLHQTRSESGFV